MVISAKQPTGKGPAARFTGEVWLDPIVVPQAPSRLSISAVHFHPGARTAWHSHSNGQILYVTEGEGLLQSRGEPIVTIRVGDVARTPADEWHWHGASANRYMTHLSIIEGDATWGEQVTDGEYGATD